MVSNSRRICWRETGSANAPCAINDVDRGWPAIADARSLGLRVLTFGNSSSSYASSFRQRRSVPDDEARIGKTAKTAKTGVGIHALEAGQLAAPEYWPVVALDRRASLARALIGWPRHRRPPFAGRAWRASLSVEGLA
jgi:hypothetical protein